MAPVAQARDRDSWQRLWLRVALWGAVLVLAYFGAWEVLEVTVFARLGLDLHALHIVRGMGATFLLATWSFLRIRRARVADETEREAQMRLVERNLEAQLRHQEKMASLGVLAAGFAHDIGNPLASISTELELLEGVDDVRQLQESVGVVRRHVSRMSRTLREMVDFARRRRDDATDVSLALAVADSARLVCHDPRWKQVQLALDVPETLPPVHMVEDHLVLVLVNLMINAADAMPNGGALTIAAREAPGAVELRLRDTGIGMAPDVLAAALTPLFTTKHHGRGTGLGLSVSSAVIESVGGTLALESTPGSGTCVIVTLPTRSSGHA